jgi:hypothetical protein
MHIGDLDGVATLLAKSWTATVTVRVEDAAHFAVSGATVTGAWSGGTSGTGSCTTGASGTCTITKTNIAKRRSSVTFTVTGVTKTGASYSGAANHDPDGSSTGTVITIAKP